ncbi:MAG TPA: glutathione S-transferase family protein [Rhabdaerophilum sp.]|nr:glutathione S-transferase family protein [Rhabdaerophilum sp.]
MPQHITLVSQVLCPYVQRIAIALAEKGVAHDRLTVDLANKPGWFLALSPLGRTPVLRVSEAALFESTAILEFLEETQPQPLHPADPVERARHRAWMGFGTECLNGIAGFYSALDNSSLDMKAATLHARFRLLERRGGALSRTLGQSARTVELLA